LRASFRAAAAAVRIAHVDRDRRSVVINNVRVLVEGVKEASIVPYPTVARHVRRPGTFFEAFHE